MKDKIRDMLGDCRGDIEVEDARYPHNVGYNVIGSPYDVGEYNRKDYYAIAYILPTDSDEEVLRKLTVFKCELIAKYEKARRDFNHKCDSDIADIKGAI